MKILISWIAHHNDFENGQVKNDGPTFNYHKYYFEGIDVHYILSSSSEDEADPRSGLLFTALKNTFPSHNVKMVQLGVKEVININMIREKVEPLLLSLNSGEIDIFMSPGTPSMQIVWFLCHTTLGLRTTLYQLKELRYSDPSLGKPERVQVGIERSFTGYSALIREHTIVKEEYKITDSLKPIYEKANLIANTNEVTTLILGESGTGKEHLARYIHDQSTRNDKPFIAVNCSAFTDDLLESRLFGHKKGSFTGADSDHKGFFECAKGGTIFLDEIGDVSPYMQQSLLRVIQGKKILPIGESREKRIDVRIIAATNRNLPALCAEGKFRWDLYYRLAVAELILPSLRERKESERIELIDFFMKAKKTLFKRRKKLVLDKDALRVILLYPFPGNVRELENLIESLYVFNEDLVTKEKLPERLLTPPEAHKLDLETVEKLHIAKVLKMVKSKNEVARTLGIAINTLNSKIRKHNLTP